MPTAFICTTCGQQGPEQEQPPGHCPICTDSRQYVTPAGQQWTTQEALARRHFSAWRMQEPGLMGLGIQPQFAIGQRCLLVDTGEGLVMWDCVPLIDAAVIRIIQAMGGLRAIAISHPHYYAAMVDWSRALKDARGDVPVWLHEADREWVLRPDPCVRHWGGDRHDLAPGLTLIRTGGHFEGSCVLHWANGAGGRGILMTGDTVQVGADRRVSFLRSYPNMVPLSHDSVQGIADALAPFDYERVYGAFFDRVVPEHGKRIVAESVARYQAALAGRY
jgi:glyoxylase-like metal-dependent hydrolase (beta-lactamase superfamily II)